MPDQSQFTDPVVVNAQTTPVATADNPMSGSIPDQSGPTPPALNLAQGLGGVAPAANAPQKGPSVFSKLFNKISSGTDTNYQIDPSTGKTVAVQTPQKPGTLFRNILAAGLLGSSGIGPQEGEHSFTQGLLAGVGGGARQAIDRNQQQDAQKRQQAQQDYANQLKAKQENREEAETNARLTLNKVQIANANLQQASLSQMAHEHLDPSETSIAQSLVAANKNTVNDLTAAGVKTYKEGLTGDELHQMITPGSPTYDAGAVSKYHGVPTGTKIVKGADGNNHEVPTYTLYDLGTTGTMQVPDTLLSRLKQSGEDKAGPGGKPSALYSELQSAYANKQPVDYRHIVAAQKEAGDTFNMNEVVQKQKLQNAEIARDQASAGAEGLRSQLERIQIAGAKLTLQDTQDAHLGQDLFTNGYQVKDPDGKPETLKIEPNDQGKYDFSRMSPDQKRAAISYVNSQIAYAQTEKDEAAKLLDKNPDDKQAQEKYKKFDSANKGFDSIKNALVPGTPYAANTPLANQGPLQQIATKWSTNLSPAANKAFNAISHLPYDQGLQQIQNAQGLTPEDRDALLASYQGYHTEAAPLIQDSTNKDNEVKKKIDQERGKQLLNSPAPIVPNQQYNAPSI